MAQSAITVTPPNPTPPTNFSFLGQTPPNAPAQPAADDGTAGTLGLFAAKIASVDNANFPSVEHEGRGTEVSVTAPGSRAEAPTIAVSCGPTLPAQTVGGAPVSPNQLHASSLTPATAAVITGLSPNNVAAGAGTSALTVTSSGGGFTKQSVVAVGGVNQTTVFVSPTSLTVAAAPKKVTAGTVPVTVTTAGTVTTAPFNWTFV